MSRLEHMSRPDLRMIELCLDVIKDRLDDQAQDDKDIAAAVEGMSEAIGERFAAQDAYITELEDRVERLENHLLSIEGILER